MSWWVGVPREDFAAKAREEQPRMALTKFGRLSTLAHGPDVHQWRPTKKQKDVFGEDYW